MCSDSLGFVYVWSLSSSVAIVAFNWRCQEGSLTLISINLIGNAYLHVAQCPGQIWIVVNGIYLSSIVHIMRMICTLPLCTGCAFPNAARSPRRQLCDILRMIAYGGCVCVSAMYSSLFSQINAENLWSTYWLRIQYLDQQLSKPYSTHGSDSIVGMYRYVSNSQIPERSFATGVLIVWPNRHTHRAYGLVRTRP